MTMTYEPWGMTSWTKYWLHTAQGTRDTAQGTRINIYKKIVESLSSNIVSIKF